MSFIARRLDLNSRSNGERETRQRLRDGHLEWLDHVGEVVSDTYPPRIGFRAAERRGETRVELPDWIDSDLMIAWTTPMRGGHASARADIAVGRIVAGPDGKRKLLWGAEVGLTVARKGDRGVVVRDAATLEVVAVAGLTS